MYKFFKVIHCCASISTLFYSIVFVCCVLFFEVEKWRFGQLAVEVPFYRLGNGLLALLIFICQVIILRIKYVVLD